MDLPADAASLRRQRPRHTSPQTGFSPQLLDQLAAWQEAFESGFHFPTGWCSRQLRDGWATQASELEAAIRAELGRRAELVVHHWPLNDD